MNREWIKSSFTLGLFALLPIMILFLLFQMIVNMMWTLCRPFLLLFHLDRWIGEYLLALFSFLIVGMLLYFIGSIIQSEVGSQVLRVVERYTLYFLPGYRRLRNLFSQFKKNENRKFFETVAVVDIFGKGVYNLCFIMGSSSKRYVVFVPTSPQPIAGFSYFIPKSRVIITEHIMLQEALRLCVSCGVGSQHLIEEIIRLNTEGKK